MDTGPKTYARLRFGRTETELALMWDQHRQMSEPVRQQLGDLLQECRLVAAMASRLGELRAAEWTRVESLLLDMTEVLTALSGNPVELSRVLMLVAMEACGQRVEIGDGLAPAPTNEALDIFCDVAADRILGEKE